MGLSKNKKKGKTHIASPNSVGYFFVLLVTVCCLFSNDSFAHEIKSLSVVVMDSSREEIVFAKNPYLRHPPASTTKLMTAIIALESANLSDVVTISRNASRVAPHRAGLMEGDQMTVEQLLYAALLSSANDAAVALSEAVAGSEKSFVTVMNRKARSIGALNTRFTNSSGLPSNGQYTTAHDLAKIMNYALRYQKLKEIIGTRTAKISMDNGNSVFLRNTNMLLWSEEDVIGGKTGYTRKSMHCFVCAAERENETLIIAILGSPSRNNLWRESGNLISKGFEVIGDKGKHVIYVTETYSDKADSGMTSYKKNVKLKIQGLKSQKGKPAKKKFRPGSCTVKNPYHSIVYKEKYF